MTLDVSSGGYIGSAFNAANFGNYIGDYYVPLAAKTIFCGGGGAGGGAGGCGFRGVDIGTGGAGGGGGGAGGGGG